ncbi:TIR domain-containing protein [Poseidonibacter lekithochrous]|uniref:TIR domain-containing protein n=1 Tax=Poseidonibacter TaxID=2321187 RepID=UPI001C09A1AC|nr:MULTISPECIES: TIR domain-containing protein [Poseidonibacter]MBU3014724.1 TIR domain-containing protein [Poseidonibacter lekithochrous]MDO6828022.1 TIR domain-containing protein [Poseidonibacter sp. 1_MG-2023]
MNQNKSQLFIVGNNNVGKTSLIRILTSTNIGLSDPRAISINYEADWIIENDKYSVFVDIKERAIINSLDARSSLLGIRENSIFIIVIRTNNDYNNIYTQIEYYLKNIPKNSIIILLFNENYIFKSIDINEKLQRTFPDRLREIIWSNITDKENFIKFKNLLENIILNASTVRLNYAKQIIENNLRTKDKILDLGNCYLTNLLEVKEVFENTHIEKLILSNEWAEYKNDKWHKSVSKNERGRNTLSDFPREIKKLENLKSLISGGDWNDGKRKWNRWNIRSIRPLLNLTKLEYLNLSNNIIEVIPSLKKLEKIAILHLNNNLIVKINNTAIINSLQELYLSNNKIRFTSFLKKFPFAKTIDIHANDIKDITPLKQLIHENNITNSKWKLNTINIAKNPLESPPIEIVNISKEAVLNYFEEMLLGETYVNKDVKLILIGNSEAGKTTLAKYLNNEFELDKKHPPTHWMEEQKLKSKYIISKIKEKCNLNLFDFGGHDYFHDTHHLFFGKNTVYLLIWNLDTNNLNIRSTKMQKVDGSIEEVKTQDYPINYWLDSIKYYTREIEAENFDFEIEKDTEYTTHVILIQNKVEKLDQIHHLNHKKIVSNYPFINDFINISLIPKRNLNHLDSLITETLNDTEILGAKLPNYYGIVKDNIARYKGKPILCIDEFQEYCTTLLGEEINNEQTIYLANYLNQVGTILYKPSIDSEGKVYIDKKWIIEKIHLILSGLVTLNGEFNDKYLQNMLGKDDIKMEKDIIGLMKDFKIIFKHPDSEKYIAPLYLPPQPIQAVKLFLNTNITPYRKIQYTGFIHKNVVLNFFQEYGKLVIKENSSKDSFYYWKNGLIIKDLNSNDIVMVQFNLGDDYGNASIDIIKLNNDSSTDFADEIVMYIHKINDGYETEEMIPKSVSEYIPLSVIHENEEKKNWTFLYADNYYNLGDFKMHLKTTNKMKKIFISYSKQDITLVNKFIDHLSALKQDGKVSNWYCTELKAGTKWDSEINKHFEESDIVCFMISPNFMRTQYIHEYEIDKAFERKKKDPKFNIVPIILDFCRWSTEINNLSEFTALPYTAKPVVDFDNQNMAWYIIEECLRLIIENDIDNIGEDLYKNTDLPQDILKIYQRIIEGKVDRNNI